MKPRPPEPDAPPAPDEILERIEKMATSCRRRAMATADPVAREAADRLRALVDAGSHDIDEARRWWHTLDWLVEAP